MENEKQTTQENEDVVINDMQDLSKTLQDVNDKYLRLYADFENYKKRVSTEYLNVQKTANKSVMLSMVTILDDFERALKNISDVEHKQGVSIIYNKLKDTLSANGLSSYDNTGDIFNADLHECVVQTPAGVEMSNKIIETLEKGYTLNDVIIRYSKVVVGA
jgi:molecular chaperone GrpE